MDGVRIGGNVPAINTLTESEIQLIAELTILKEPIPPTDVRIQQVLELIERMEAMEAREVVRKLRALLRFVVKR